MTSSRAVRRGIVAEFDFARGLGTIRDAGAPSSVVPFHCTAISDGTRDVAVGTPVAFRLAPGGLGLWEAGEVVKLAGAPASEPVGC